MTANKYERAYAALDDENLEWIYGMKMTDYSIGSPSILTNYIDVPGRPGMLDATLALNGKVNYTKRSVSAEFHVSDITHDDYMGLMKVLREKYHGQQSKLSFSFDSGWYYKGRYEVSGSKSNAVSADITISSSNVFPYKLEKESVIASISSSGKVTCKGKTYNGTVTVNASKAQMSVTFDGTTYALVAGDNLLPEICLVEGDNILTFKGTGKVKVTYERGVL